MRCPEKEMLQQNCSAAWDAFEQAMESLGIPLDPQIGPVMSRLMKGFACSGVSVLENTTGSTKGVGGLIDPKTGMGKPPFRDALSLLHEHGKASSLLSRHLHTHRC